MIDKYIKNSIQMLYTQGSSIRNIAKQCNIPISEVIAILKECGYNVKTQTKWTQEEEILLKSLTEYLAVNEIAGILNKTPYAINSKMQRLGIKSVRSWTQAEEDFLMDHWGLMQVEAIATTLNRSVKAVKQKAIALNLLSARNEAGFLKINDVAAITGLSPYKIKSFAKQGLIIKTNYITRNSKFYYIEMEDLLDFLYNNQDLYNATNFELSYFPNCPQWLKNKKQNDIQKPMAQHKPWTTQDKKLANQMFSKGYSVSEIAQALGRTKHAIYHFSRQSYA